MEGAAILDELRARFGGAIVETHDHRGDHTAVVDRDRAYLWAGAGIVAGSDADRELAETELKLRAMLGALGVSA